LAFSVWSHNGHVRHHRKHSLNEAIDYASSCPEKLQWLVDQGFVEEVEEELKPARFVEENQAGGGHPINKAG